MIRRADAAAPFDRKRAIAYAVCIICALPPVWSLPTQAFVATASLPAVVNRIARYVDLVFEDLIDGALRPPPKPSGHVVVVDMDPRASARKEEYPPSRARHARAIDHLLSAGAALVVVDISFATNAVQESRNRALLDAVRRSAGRALFVRGIQPTATGITWDSLMDGLEHATRDAQHGPGYGAAMSPIDVDGVIRRAQIAWSSDFPDARTLSVCAVERFTGVKADITAEAVRFGARRIPLSAGSLEVRVPHFEQLGLSCGFTDVADGRVDPALVKNRIVVIIPPSLFDGKTVRYSGMDYGPAPGGFILAATIDTLLTGDTVPRAPHTTVFLASVVLVVLMAMVLWRFPTLGGLVLGTGVLSLLWLATVVVTMWLTRTWINLVAPWAAMVAVAVVIGAYEGVRARRAFSRFLPKALVEHGLSRGFEREHEKGQTTDASVMFVDLQRFTQLSEQVSGETLVAIVNRLHTALAAVVEAEGGTVIDYMGDAQLVVFGVPTRLDDHALRAARAARRIPDAVAAASHDLRARFPELDADMQIGIGVASGPVTWGFIGSHGHQEFAALGNTTNLAARLQAKTREHGVRCIISAETKRAIGDALPTRALGEESIRGKQQPQRIYALIMPDASPPAQA